MKNALVTGLFTLAVLGLGAADGRLRASDEVWVLEGTLDRAIDSVERATITNGKAVIGIGLTPTLGIYDVSTGTHLRDITIPERPQGLLEKRTFAAIDDLVLVSDTVWAPNDFRGHSSAYVYNLTSGALQATLELPTPDLRVGMGASLATDGQLGVVSSISCGTTCFDLDPQANGVIDVFDMSNGKHLLEIPSPDDQVFGQGLAIQNGVIAVSSRSRQLTDAGRVHLFNAATGELEATLTPEIAAGETAGSRHNFGFDLAMDGNRLVVGDNPDLLGHGAKSDGKGIVSIYDFVSTELLAEFTTEDVGLVGTPQFGKSVAIDGDTVIVGAPLSGAEIVVLDLQGNDPRETETGACLESFTTGGHCSEDAVPFEMHGTARGAVVFIDLPTKGAFSRAFLGGTSVAIGNDHALVQSSVDEFGVAYSISLAGLISKPDPEPPKTPGEIPAILTPEHGDLDEDGRVAFSDFLILSTNFGLRVEAQNLGDINLNGLVDFPDFLILAANFGLSNYVATQAVPEPSTLGMTLFFGLWLTQAACRTRRRRTSDISLVGTFNVGDVDPAMRGIR